MSLTTFEFVMQGGHLAREYGAQAVDLVRAGDANGARDFTRDAIRVAVASAFRMGVARCCTTTHYLGENCALTSGASVSQIEVSL